MNDLMLKAIGVVKRLVSFRTEYDAIGLELARQRSNLAIITGNWETADLLLNLAKEKAGQLALSSPYSHSEILIAIIDQMFRRVAAGFAPEYVMERIGNLQTIEDLQAMGILAVLNPEKIIEG